MYKLALIFFLFISQAQACEYLDGHWKSNKKMSMEYNNGLMNLPKNTTQLFEQIFGIQEIVYIGNIVHILEGPTIEVEINGESNPFYFEEIKETVSFAKCTEDLVVIETEQFFGDNNDIHIESKNTYWVSPFSTWREYFVRVE